MDGPELAEYAALRAKVDSFAEGVQQRRQADLMCRRGCAACCHAHLSVSAVEAAAIACYLAALPAAQQAALRARGARHHAAAIGAPRCAMLADDQSCAIYPVRPLVCRTQGLPLRYPDKLVPASALLGRSAGGGALTWCPLNFTARPPAAADVLDATRVDELLAVVNHRFAAGAGTPPLSRYPLAALAAAAGAAELPTPTAAARRPRVRRRSRR